MGKTEDKSKDQLLEELAVARQCVVELEALKAEYEQAIGASQWGERCFRSIIEAASGAIIIADSHGNIVLWNKAAETIWGYSAEEVYGKPLSLIIPERFHKLFNKRSKDTVPSGETKILDKAVEMIGFRKDGSDFPFDFSMARCDIRGEGFFTCIIHDITERKKAEEGLKRERDSTQRYLDVAGVMLLVIGSDQKVKLINKMGCEILGYKEEEIIDKDWCSNFIPEEICCIMRSEIDTLFKKAFWGKNREKYYKVSKKHLESVASGRIRWYSPEELESLVITKDNGERIIYWRVVPLYDEKGEISAILTSGGDITERRQAEDALREYQHNLEMMVENQAIELKKANRQWEQKITELKYAEEKLKAQIEQRMEFSRSLIHELKTPLMPIIGASELLVNNLNEEPWQRLARQIYKGASDLDRRVNELFDLTKGEMGMLQLRCELIHPMELLKEVTDYMAPELSRKQQTLTLELPCSLPIIWGDHERLRQVITNLLNNASKFTPEEANITLQARKKRGNLIIEVQDTGCGVVKEKQSLLFKPYYQLGDDYQGLGGLGLGLALCKTIVELHGGKLWMKSQRGVGSTFSFSIPLDKRQFVGGGC